MVVTAPDERRSNRELFAPWPSLTSQPASSAAVAGRSAVLSAAYRHCAKMEYEREARTIDYTRKEGLAA